MNALAHGAVAPALTVIDGIPTTASHDIAKHFGKRHEHVMDAIRALLAQLPESAHPNFRVSDYADPTGRRLPAYRLTRDGFTLLAMGFTGAKALAFKLAYIDAFNRIEAELRQPPAPMAALAAAGVLAGRFLVNFGGDGAPRVQVVPPTAVVMTPEDCLAAIARGDLTVPPRALADFVSSAVQKLARLAPESANNGGFRSATHHG